MQLNCPADHKLTDEEIKQGWHFCHEFDGLCRNSNEEDFKCDCNEYQIKPVKAEILEICPHGMPYEQCPSIACKTRWKLFHAFEWLRVEALKGNEHAEIMMQEVIRLNKKEQT